MKDLRYARGAANGQAALLLAALSTGTPCSQITMASDFAFSIHSPLPYGANLNIIIRGRLPTLRNISSSHAGARGLFVGYYLLLLVGLLFSQHQAFPAIGNNGAGWMWEAQALIPIKQRHQWKLMLIAGAQDKIGVYNGKWFVFVQIL